MNNVVNSDIKKWIRPWNTDKFNDLYNRDDRFFAILTKGMISWLNRNIVMYDKPIQHFIYNTGSSYLYVENNGYEYSWTETTGEDYMYMTMPRCIINLQDISIPQEELTSPYARGNYERIEDNELKSYNAEIRRLPINMSVNLTYVLSNFNEYIILVQELIEKIIFQKYFKITYLGQIIQCSIEYPESLGVELNRIDMSSPEVNQKTVQLTINICTNYPIINERSSILSTSIISSFTNNITYNDEELSRYTPNNRDLYRIDYSKYDINNDNILDDFEINIASSFIERCDLNNDGCVDRDDLLSIIRIFINNEYNINLDLDNDNVISKNDIQIIVKYFKYLDVNFDGIVDKNDITLYLNNVNEYINNAYKYDYDNNLIIDSNDIKIYNNLKNKNGSIIIYSDYVQITEYINKLYNILSNYDDPELNELKITVDDLHELLSDDEINRLNAIIAYDNFKNINNYVNLIKDLLRKPEPQKIIKEYTFINIFINEIRTLEVGNSPKGFIDNIIDINKDDTTNDHEVYSGIYLYLTGKIPTGKWVDHIAYLIHDN